MVSHLSCNQTVNDVHRGIEIVLKNGVLPRLIHCQATFGQIAILESNHVPS